MAVIRKIGSINMLTAGLFEGFASCSSIAAAGEVGLGTFHGLDGEMVLVDGGLFRIGIDGNAQRVGDDATSPFAVAGTFESPTRIELAACDGWDGLMQAMDAHLPNRNRPAVIRIDGTFTRMKARSVPGQSRPYPSLGEVARKQAIFDLEPFEGSMVGFRFPHWLQAIDVAGHHLHAIDRDRTIGGHVLDVAFERATLLIESASRFEVMLPDDEAFRNATLESDTHAEVQEAERA